MLAVEWVAPTIGSFATSFSGSLKLGLQFGLSTDFRMPYPLIRSLLAVGAYVILKSSFFSTAGFTGGSVVLAGFVTVGLGLVSTTTLALGDCTVIGFYVGGYTVSLTSGDLLPAPMLVNKLGSLFSVLRPDGETTPIPLAVEGMNDVRRLVLGLGKRLLLITVLPEQLNILLPQIMFRSLLYALRV